MDIKSLKLIYFSPTKTTQKILEGIAEGIAPDSVQHIDLSPPDASTQTFEEMHDEFVIVGVPVYSGRVPLEAKKRLQRLKANNTPAAVVVVYGNREFEDALLELKNLASEAGFIPVAGGAFIGEHSFSNEATPIAVGRPDAEDLKKAKEFGKLIGNRMTSIHTLDEISLVAVPGAFPHRERGNPSKISPITRKTLCTTCGTCATVCPTAAITVNDSVITDATLCILCCACIKNCPTGARVMEEPHVKQIAEWLHENYSDRKEPEIFFNT